VGNKVRNEEEKQFLEMETSGLPLLGVMPADLGVQEADRLGIPVYEHVPALRQAAEAMAKELDAVLLKAVVE
jgi:CO dehydrogenase nickel-insertion accessory protein CooC1